MFCHVLGCLWVGRDYTEILPGNPSPRLTGLLWASCVSAVVDTTEGDKNVCFQKIHFLTGEIIFSVIWCFTHACIVLGTVFSVGKREISLEELRVEYWKYMLRHVLEVLLELRLDMVSCLGNECGH